MVFVSFLRSSLLDAPEAPEELRRLAWQTDQMRRRSENDQVVRDLKCWRQSARGSV